MKYKEFVVLDVETTGVDAKRDDIIEFAAVKLNAKGGIIGELEMLIGTDQPISPTVTALTGIRTEDVVGKPTIDAVLDKIRSFIGDAPIVGHNIGFDIEFLNSKGCDLGNPSLDTLELAYTVLPAQSYYSLEYLARHFNFPNQPSHRAMSDVLAAVDLFKLLVTQVRSWSETTRATVAKLVPEGSWTWGWLAIALPEFDSVSFKEDEDGREIIVQIAQEVESADQWLSQIEAAKDGAINFVEAHFDIDPLALNLAYALQHKPAVLVVDQAEFWKVGWGQLAGILEANLACFFGTKTLYNRDAEVRLAGSGKPLSSLEARLVTKITAWKQEWGQDPAKLFMPQEERYQWEQKISPLESPTLSELGDADVIVAPAHALPEIPDLDRFEIVTHQPLLLEDHAVFSQARVFSVPYLTAAISSRRDFVHQYIRPQDVRLADELFKLLHHISSNFNKLTERLIKIYTDNPPQSIYDRDIELDTSLIDDEFTQLLEEIVRNLRDYLTQLNTLDAVEMKRQREQTERLLVHLLALKDLTADFRYFLRAEQNRFFLELIPSRVDFTVLANLIGKSRGLMAIAPGLSVSGKFDYFEKFLGPLNGRVLSPTAKTDLLLIDEIGDGALHNMVNQLIQRPGRSLILATSAYEARETFNQLFEAAHKLGGVLESYDTVGNVLNVSGIADQHEKFALIGHYYWFKQIRWQRDSFDRVVLSKMQFDPVSRPRFKVLGEQNSFESYILPRAIMRLKEILHLVKLWHKPIILVDERLTSKDYGQQVINSLNAFTVIPTPVDEALE